MKKFKVCLSGARGRMAQAVLDLAKNHHRIEVVSGLEVSGYSERGMPPVFSADQIEHALKNVDVLLIFIKPPDAAAAQALLAATLGVQVVIGTTGLTPDHFEVLKDLAAKKVAVFQAFNFSLGVAVMTELVRMAAALLPDHQVDVLDDHHKDKFDSPSGTAVNLLKAVCYARGLDFDNAVTYDQPRHRDAPRGNAEIGVHCVRAGQTVGDHDVTLAGSGEVVTVSHHAINREVFAAGALEAVEFAAKAGPGLYGMRDLVGLPTPDEFLSFLRGCLQT